MQINSQLPLQYQIESNPNENCMICLDGDKTTTMIAHTIIHAEKETSKKNKYCIVHMNCLKEWIDTQNRVYHASIDCPQCRMPIQYDHIPKINEWSQDVQPPPSLEIEREQIQRLYSNLNGAIKKLACILKEDQYKEVRSRLEKLDFNLERIKQDVEQLIALFQGNEDGSDWGNPLERHAALGLLKRLDFLFADTDFQQIVRLRFNNLPGNTENPPLNLVYDPEVINHYRKLLSERWYILLLCAHNPYEINRQINLAEAILQQNNFIFNSYREHQPLFDLLLELGNKLPRERILPEDLSLRGGLEAAAIATTGVFLALAYRNY